MSNDIEVTRNGHVLEVKLQRGKVNAIDVPTSQALAAAFCELRDDPELRGKLMIMVTAVLPG